MKTLSAFAVLFALACASTLVADDQPSPEEIEAQLMELGAPGEEHERFQEMVGDWDCEIKMYLPDTDEPLVSEGSASFEVILDGRFLVQDFEGEMGGMKFSGHGMSGFDRVQNKYVGVWSDSYSTGMMSMEGSLDEETGVMTEIGQIVIPGGEMKFKMETREISEDQFHFTMYAVGPDGSEAKQLEITYTRADE